jgi:Fe-S cluster biogenesis protein NfuA
MADDRDFRAKIQRISELVAELDTITQPEIRASAKALVQLILDLNAAGLEQAMEILAKDGEIGQKMIDNLGQDALVSSLLVLYGLHPLDLESRVEQALDKVRASVQKGGGELELLSFTGGTVRLRLRVTGHSCGSTGNTLKRMVEDALFEAAPDMTGLLIEGLDEAGSVGFVPLGKLGGAIAGAAIS